MAANDYWMTEAGLKQLLADLVWEAYHWAASIPAGDCWS